MIDLTGQKHGNLTVLKYIGNHRWQCQCTCGNTVNVLADTLLRHAALRCSRSCTAPPPTLTKYVQANHALSAYLWARSGCAHSQPATRKHKVVR